MAQKYTRFDTENQIKEATKDMSTFYRANCVNYTGTTFKSDGGEYYTEIVSEYLLDNYDLFDQIKTIKRDNYKIETHNGTTPRTISNRKEERIALAMYGKNIWPIGKIIDYQVPLKSKQADGAGKIDLIAFDESTGILRLIELKAPKANDTLLRCVLEIFTYRKIVDKDALIKSYELDGKCTEIRICPLFFKDSKQDKEYEDFANRLGKYNKLMSKLQQKPRNCLFFVELMNRIRFDISKVELLRFPFTDAKLVSNAQVSSSKATKTADGTSVSSAMAQAGNACPTGPIVMLPIYEQPNGFPLALEEVTNCETETLEKWEIEILDY